ncbi:MAG TPA: CDP-diacylglycerol--serine O-phosphatidyltransferase [Flavobacterium sp.]|uniref:CDP-diacylglycerol--serine O-phosphatidyltransferase n=1 Tax=Flavobacterium sp. TaxID=239 RepID=UPI002C8DCC20|nr:CDP-diacylglycerol--serine O-phosphatidyltransferase [Flavobacterium sp.]HPW98949.1 CDP-diacylglycerol--serine O-phosphatidyltransferase [Flavobacterium sp.]HQA73630.1 CDP-diacylglycerol--serine O-phosphatidyltransferase [Flavobacterium sp.]
MNIKAQIPNMFTMLNLFSGCVALVFVAEFNFELAFYFVCLGIFFDFFDGFFARKFDVAGPLGVQLDSLADMVTSGVVPGFVMFQMIKKYNSIGFEDYLPFLGFIITLGACYRLAKFNIDTRQSDSFIGLPTPANALFITSLPLVFKNYTNNSIVELLHNEWFLLMITFISAYIMNAEIPLFSLKIKNFSVAKYKFQLFFLLFSVLLLVFLQILAVPLIIISYVLLSVVNNLISKESK